jgi:hypothetical protein
MRANIGKEYIGAHRLGARLGGCEEKARMKKLKKRRSL